MAARMREVANLPDPLGKRLAATELDQGLILHKESCPLGVIAVVFESRPDVVSQIASLAFKSGNAVLLKGGSEAACSNESIVGVWKETLCRFADVPQESIHLLQSRSDGWSFCILRANRSVGPARFERVCRVHGENSRIPILGHGEGICHVFVDRTADLNKAFHYIGLKVQYPAACNSVETLARASRYCCAIPAKSRHRINKCQCGSSWLSACSGSGS